MDTDTGEIKRFKDFEKDIKKMSGNWIEIEEKDIEVQINKLIADPTVKKIVISKNRQNQIQAVIPYR